MKGKAKVDAKMPFFAIWLTILVFTGIYGLAIVEANGEDTLRGSLAVATGTTFILWLMWRLR